VRPYLQNNQSKKVGSLAQAVQCLTHKNKAPNSNSNTAKKKKKKFLYIKVNESII
jgi:hypothetical protein